MLSLLSEDASELLLEDEALSEFSSLDELSLLDEEFSELSELASVSSSLELLDSVVAAELLSLVDSVEVDDSRLVTTGGFGTAVRNSKSLSSESLVPFLTGWDGICGMASSTYSQSVLSADFAEHDKQCSSSRSGTSGGISSPCDSSSLLLLSDSSWTGSGASLFSGE